MDLRNTNTSTSIAWAAQLIIDRHRCGPCERCPADPAKTCPRLHAALLDAGSLGLPHPRH